LKWEKISQSTDYWEICPGNCGALQNESAENWVVIDNLHLVIMTKEHNHGRKWLFPRGHNDFL
jgi:hypothetical protein